MKWWKSAAFALSFLLLLSGPSWAESSSSLSGPAAAVSYETSATELSRLIEISRRLEELNAKLQNELSVSKEASERSSNELSTLRTELEDLRVESEALRTELAGLRRKSEESLTESAGLREALAKAEASSEKWERSWKEYEAEVQRQFRALRIQRNTAAGAAVLFFILIFVL